MSVGSISLRCYLNPLFIVYLLLAALSIIESGILVAYYDFRAIPVFSSVNVSFMCLGSLMLGTYVFTRALACFVLFKYIMSFFVSCNLF